LNRAIFICIYPRNSPIRGVAVNIIELTYNLRQKSTNKFIIVPNLPAEGGVIPGPFHVTAWVAFIGTVTYLRQQTGRGSGDFGDAINPDLPVNVLGRGNADGVCDGERPLQVSPSNRISWQRADFVGIACQTCCVVDCHHFVIDPLAADLVVVRV